MSKSYIVGADLSGPASPERSSLACFQICEEGLVYRREICDGTDQGILSVLSKVARASEVVVGIDAPLSYQPGGGQRERDADLRRRLIDHGLEPGSVMAPTFQRMAWLTLRGMGVARLIASLTGDSEIKVVEVHPGGSFALGGAPIEAIREFSRRSEACDRLLRWLGKQSVEGLPQSSSMGSHFVAACGAALAAWKWHNGNSAWLAQAEPPWHPYDFAC